MKKIVSIALCAAMTVSMTACNQKSDPQSAATTTSNTLDDDIINPVDINEFVEKDDTLENPNLLYLGFYDMRVAGDIKPAVKLFEETYGCVSGPGRQGKSYFPLLYDTEYVYRHDRLF